MAVQVGSVRVPIVPDGSRFRALLNAILASTHANVTVAVDADTTNARRQILSLTSARHIVKLELQITNLLRIRRELASLGTGSRGVTFNLHVDTLAASAQLHLLYSFWNGRTITFNVNANTAIAAAQIAAFVAFANALLSTINIGGSIGGGANSASSALSSLGGVVQSVVTILAITVVGAGALAAALVALAVAANIVAGAIAVLPAAIFGVAGAFGVLLVAIAPVLKAFTAWTALQGAQGKAAHTTVNQSRQITSARKAELAAERALIDARKQAAKQIEDMQQKAIDGALDEQQAVLDLQDARLAYDAALADPRATSTSIAQAELNVRQQERNLEKIRKSNEDNADALTEAQRKGIEGSDLVVAAQERLIASHEAVGSAQETASTQAAAYASELDNLSGKGLELLGVLQQGYDLFFRVSKIFQELALPGVITFLETFLGLFGAVNKKTGEFVDGPLMPALRNMASAVSVFAAAFAVLFDPSTIGGQQFVQSLQDLINVGADFISILGPSFASVLSGIVEGMAELAKAAQDSGLLDAFSEGIANLGPAFKDFFAELAKPEVMNALVEGLKSLMGALAVALPSLGKFLGQLATVGGPLLTQLADSGLFKALGDAILALAQPDTLAAFVDLIKVFADIITQLVADGTMAQIADLMTLFFRTIADFMKDWGPALKDFLPLLVFAMLSLATGIIEVLTWLIELGGWISRTAPKVMGWLLDKITEVTNKFNEWKNKITEVRDWVINKLNDLVNFFVNLPGRITTATLNAFSGLVNAAKGAFQSVLEAWNKLDFKIDIAIPDWIPVYGGKHFVIDDIIPDLNIKLAEGGIVSRPTLAMIGEGGEPEAVVPLSRFASFASQVGAFQTPGSDDHSSRNVVQNIIVNNPLRERTSDSLPRALRKAAFAVGQ